MTTTKKTPNLAQLAKRKGTWVIQEAPKERLWATGFAPSLWATRAEIERALRLMPDAKGKR